MSGETIPLRRRLLLAGCAAIAVALAAGLLVCAAYAQSDAGPPPLDDAIVISADYSQEWTDEHDASALLRGRCRISQGNTTLRADKIVVWRQLTASGREQQTRVAVYLEDNVRVDQPGTSLTHSMLFLELLTSQEVQYDVNRRNQVAPPAEDALLGRAREHRQAASRNSLLKTQMVVSNTGDLGPELRAVQLQQPAGTMRRVRIFPRSAVPIRFDSFLSNTTPPERVWVLDGGVNLLIDGVADERLGEVGTIDLSADRMVVWTRSAESEDFQTETVQQRDEPFTVYLEGHIILRQGNLVLRAERAVYDARDERALLLDAELRAFVPRLGGDVRVRAREIRQLSENNFHARDAYTTTSTFGKPGYRVQSTDVFVEDRFPRPLMGLGGPAPPVAGPIDPRTGMPASQPTTYITSLNNTLFLDDLPVFYLPYLSAPAEDPKIPIRRATVTQDSVFGFQIETVFDTFQLLGLEQPPGVEWDLLLNLYTERGPGVGTGGRYGGSNLFGIPGVYSGEGLAIYYNDQGKDNLGRDRRSIDPETNDRYRLFLRHRQDMPSNISLFGEIGVISDRNFLEQYYEKEFDEEKDNETLLYGKQQVDNWAWTAIGRVRANDFETTTEWLPRGDLYTLSEPLFGGWLTWSQHSYAGYGKLRTADGPGDPDEVFTPLPFTTTADGGVLMTRHQLDAPFSLGPVRVVPYALGEAAYFGEDFTGDDRGRLVGSTGLRSSLLVWRVFPYVQSRILNLNGLAHKMVFEAEYAATGVSDDLSDIPQYNEFDDNAQERFRQRLVVNTFGGALPPQFEPRFYAVRTGAGLSVTAPYHELVDDQQVARFAWRQRLQTKVGPPDRMRIKDWMTLDLEASLFPDEDRDNFGEDFGLLGAHYAWYVGDRTRLLADALYDTFDDAQQLWNVGVLTQRSERGSAYVGLRQVKGAGLDSQILTLSYSYRMGPKWISTFGTSFDLGENENRGQSLTVTRIGADFLVHVGANFDSSKGSSGIGVSVEPRFLNALSGSSTQLSSLLGTR